MQKLVVRSKEMSSKKMRSHQLLISSYFFFGV